MMNIESIQAFYLHSYFTMQVFLLYSPMLALGHHRIAHDINTLSVSNDDEKNGGDHEQQTAHSKRIGLCLLLLFFSYVSFVVL